MIGTYLDSNKSLCFANMNDQAISVDLKQESELVVCLLQRQDEVLEQLDQLNHQIETILKSLVGVRESD